MGRIFEFREPVLNIALLNTVRERLRVLSGNRQHVFPRTFEDMDVVRFYFTEVQGYPVNAMERTEAARVVRAPALRRPDQPMLVLLPEGNLVDLLVETLGQFNIYGVTLVRAPSAAITTFVATLFYQLMFFEVTSDDRVLLEGQMPGIGRIPIVLKHFVDVPNNLTQSSLQIIFQRGLMHSVIAPALGARLFQQARITNVTYDLGMPDFEQVFHDAGLQTTALEKIVMGESSFFHKPTLRVYGANGRQIQISNPYTYDTLRVLKLTGMHIDVTTYPILLGVQEISLERCNYTNLLDGAGETAPVNIGWTSLELENTFGEKSTLLNIVLTKRFNFPNLKTLRLVDNMEPVSLVEAFSFCTMPVLQSLFIAVRPGALLLNNRIAEKFIRSLCAWLASRAAQGQRLSILRVVLTETSIHQQHLDHLRNAFALLHQNWRQFSQGAQIFGLN